MRIRACLFPLLTCLFGTPAWGQGGCNISVDQDSYIKESSPGDNHGTLPELSNKMKAGDDFRCVYRFDLSGIPGGDTVTSATAWFYVTATDSQPVEVYRITGTWVEGVVNWLNTGSAYDNTTVHGTIVPSATGWVSVDLTSLVQGWHDGTWPNHGLMFISTSNDTESKYTSREWSTASQRPCMEVSSSPATVNYRSIGTGNSYSTPDASISSGSSIVTFGGAASLPTDIGRGDKLEIPPGGETFYILSRDSPTQVTVQTAATGNHTNSAYTITRAYNTLQAWETARQGDLVADNRQEVGICYDDGSPFTAPLTIDGSTTNATHYMTLTVAGGHRHLGVAGGGVWIDATSNFTKAPIEIYDSYTQVEWIEIANVTNDKSGITLWSPGDNVTISNVLIHDVSWPGIMCTSGNLVTIRNSILYNVDKRPGIAIALGTGVVENCTIYNGTDDGVRIYPSATGSIRNTISVNNAAMDFRATSGTVTAFDYNMYTTYVDVTPGAHDKSPANDPADLFVSITPGAEDLHLKVEDNLALDNGLDLSGSFTNDIDDELRSVPWDIGADHVSMTVNYRSIGTNPATLHSDTASINAAERIVKFSSPTLPANIGRGDELVIGGETLYIYSRDSDSQVTVQGVAAATHTNATADIKRAYITLQAWEDARSVGNFLPMALNKKEIGVAYNDGSFTAGLVWSYIGAGDNNMKLTVAEGQRHNGTPGSGVILDATTVAAADVISVTSSGQELEWFEITNLPAGKEAIQTATGVTGGYTFSNLLIHDDDALTGIRIRDDGVIRNCVIYGAMGAGIRVVAAGTIVTIENCTVYGIAGNGIYQSTTPTVSILNTISVGNTMDDFLLEGTVDEFDHNMYESTAGGFTTGANDKAPPPGDPESLFISVTAPVNLHLEASGHDAIDTGTDRSSSFTDDIDGGTRTGLWDMGADEYGAGGGPAKPRIVSWREVAPS